VTLLLLLLLAGEDVGALRAQLASDDVAERHAAAAALGAAGEGARAALPDLIDRLGDGDGAVRIEAARALVLIGVGREEAKRLIGRLESVDADLGPLLAEAIAGTDAVEMLVECPSPYAALALGYMGRAGVRGLPALLSRAGQPYVDEAIRRLAPWGAPVVPELVDRLRIGEPPVRALAARVLGLVGPAAREAVPYLKEATAEGPDDLRAAARAALEKIASATAVSEHPLLRKPEECNAEAPARFRVLFETTKGGIEVEVVRAWAPHGADRFFNLVRVGFFRGARFFRVKENFIAQFGLHGDSRVGGLWRGREIPDDPPRQKNLRGTLSFAMAGPGTRTTQLFFNLKDNVGLDPQGFAPIGRVTKGIERLVALHSGYGEEPDQQSIQYSGNEYLDRNFPELDSIRDARILDE